MAKSASRSSVATPGFFVRTELILSIPLPSAFFRSAEPTAAAPVLAPLLGELLLIYAVREGERHLDNALSRPRTPAIKRTPMHPTEVAAYGQAKERWKTAILKQICVWSSKPVWKCFSSRFSLTVMEEVLNEQCVHLLLQQHGSLGLSQVNVFTMCCNATEATAKGLQLSISLFGCLAPRFGDHNKNCSRQSFREAVRRKGGVALHSVLVCLVAPKDFRENADKWFKRQTCFSLQRVWGK